MSTNLKKRWADCKSLYEETVGKRKPSKDFLSFIARSGTGIEGGLGDYDKQLSAYEDQPSDPAHAKLVAAGTTAKQAMGKYAKVLADRTRQDKLTDPAYTKGLSVLTTELEAIATVIDESSKSARDHAKMLAKAEAANHDSRVVAALLDKNAVKSFAARGATILKELAAAMAKVGAKPDPKTYGDMMRPALRDIGNTFGATNLTKLGLGNLVKSSAYPRKAIQDLADMDIAQQQPDSEQAVAAALKLIGPRLAVVKTWFVNAAGG